MKFQYNRPRIKPIYPVYQLNDELFRIGAQRESYFNLLSY